MILCKISSCKKFVVLRVLFRPRATALKHSRPLECMMEENEWPYWFGLSHFWYRDFEHARLCPMWSLIIWHSWMASQHIITQNWLRLRDYSVYIYVTQSNTPADTEWFADRQLNEIAAFFCSVEFGVMLQDYLQVCLFACLHFSHPGR